jgi:hypothetical protein
MKSSTARFSWNAQLRELEVAVLNELKEGYSLHDLNASEMLHHNFTAECAALIIRFTQCQHLALKGRVSGISTVLAAVLSYEDADTIAA